jgi:YVTN family beta-propeller protein
VLILAGGALLLVAAIAAAVTVLAGGGSEVKLTAPDSVAVIDPSSGRIHATIPLGASPGGVAAGRGAVWVAITDQGTVLRVDPRTDAVRQTIRVGAGPAAVAAGGGAAWAANGADGTVSRIDPATNQVVQRIRVGNGPTGAAYGDGAVWVANSVDGTVSRIDPASGRVTRTFPAIVGATGVAFGFGRLWVVSSSAGEVASLDPASGDVVDRIGVGVDPDAIAVGLRAVWVANRADDTVSRIDPSPPAHVASAVPVGRAPNSLAVAGGGVWVANGGDGTLMRIDAAKGRVVKTVHLGDRPQGLAASPAGLYAAVRSSGAEHRGGTLRVVQGAPDSVDPAVAYSAEAWAILMMTNDGLVGFRRVGGIEGVQVVPDLATALPMPTAGGRTYTFRLRPGVRYSTGRPVQPEDFRRAIERVFQIRPASQTPAPQYLGGIVGARSCHPASCDLSRGIVTDARTRTVTFHLTAPDAGFLAKLALPFAFVVPSTTPASEIQRRPLPATGPYRLVSYRKGTSATLVRNPRFREWSADAQPSGYPDVLDFTFTGFNPESAVRAVSGGSADVARGVFPLPRRALEALASRFPSQLHLSTVAGTAFFFLNTRAAPFDDVRVRRAVNYAFDQQALARRTGLGSAPTCQIVPPDFPAYKPICPYGSGGSAGAVRARQLAGSSAGKPVTVWVPPPRVTEGRYMVSVLDALGLRARLKVAGSIDAYFNSVNDPKSRVQVGWYPWVADYPSQIGFLASLFSCAEFVLPTRFCDPQVQRTLAQATAAEAQNPPAAPALWQKAERQILAQGPIVPIDNPQDANFVSKRVGDFQYHPQWGVLLDQLWVR